MKAEQRSKGTVLPLCMMMHGAAYLHLLAALVLALGDQSRTENDDEKEDHDHHPDDDEQQFLVLPPHPLLQRLALNLELVCIA